MNSTLILTLLCIPLDECVRNLNKKNTKEEKRFIVDKILKEHNIKNKKIGHSPYTK